MLGYKILLHCNRVDSWWLSCDELLFSILMDLEKFNDNLLQFDKGIGFGQHVLVISF